MRRRLRSAAVLGAVVAVLVRAGAVLPAPPADPARWAGWLDDRGAVPAALALVRLGALVVAALVVVAAVAAVSARAFGAVRVAGAVERILPPSLRRAVAGLGLASAVAVGAGPAAAEPPDGTATMTVLAAEDDAPAPAPPTDAAPAPAPAAAPASTPAPGANWTVEPGDSFWSIAVDVLADAAGREPDLGEVDRYWRALVDANRDRLVSPNPDLILPGQVFVLPPPA